MKKRSAELKARNRRVFAWSLGAAAAIHVALFVLVPTFRADDPPAWSLDEASETAGWGPPLLVDLVFTAPDIFERDGTLSPESPDLRLEVDHVIQLPPSCPRYRTERLVARGRVRLRVYTSGRVDVVEVAESSGSECGDEAIAAVADLLRYGWLPSERFPAPLDVIQPVTLAEAF